MLRNTFYMASGVSAFLGLFSFLLPDTPPKGKGAVKPTTREMLGLDALSMLKERITWSFFIASMLICIPWHFIIKTQTSSSMKEGWQCCRKNDIWTGIRSIVYALSAVFFVAFRIEDYFAARHAGVADSLFAVCIWRS
jgi:hypothetical protein